MTLETKHTYTKKSSSRYREEVEEIMTDVYQNDKIFYITFTTMKDEEEE